jgi:hypothetical protein
MDMVDSENERGCVGDAAEMVDPEDEPGSSLQTLLAIHSQIMILNSSST